MKVEVILCDYAQVAEGKLNIIGGGWSFIGPQPTPMGLAVLVSVPWNETNSRHRLGVELLGEDGEDVSVGGADRIRIESEFEVGRPPGLPPGSDQLVPFAFNLGPLPLPPGSRYRWKLYLDDVTCEDWGVSFGVRPETSAAR